MGTSTNYTRLYAANGPRVMLGVGLFGRRNGTTSRLVMVRCDARGWHVVYGNTGYVYRTLREAMTVARRVVRLTIHEKEVAAMVAFYGPVLNA